MVYAVHCLRALEVSSLFQSALQVIRVDRAWNAMAVAVVHCHFALLDFRRHKDVKAPVLALTIRYQLTS